MRNLVLNLDWEKNGNDWHKLEDLETLYVFAKGVYVIWYGDGKPEESVLYVGQGDVANRLVKHQIDEKFKRFSHRGLYVSWAEVPR